MCDHMSYYQLPYTGWGTGGIWVAFDGLVVPGGLNISGGNSTAGLKEIYHVQ